MLIPSRKKEPLLDSLPPLENYLSQINLDRVAEAIQGPEGTPRLAEYDEKDLKNMVWTAAEKFLVRDLHDMVIDGVEEPYERELHFPGGAQVFRGIKDLTGTLHGRLNVTKKFAGRKVVIDWKTSHKTLDTTWDERLLDSWQWRKYLYFGGADVMLYRGVNAEGKTRELLIERPANLESSILAQLEGVSAARNSLINAGLTVYPRKMPSACGAFGRECPYWTDCREHTMPQVALLPGRSFSYSSMDRFLACPERYRRGEIENEMENTEESNFGTAFHRGIAELYGQARQLFQENV